MNERQALPGRGAPSGVTQLVIEDELHATLAALKQLEQAIQGQAAARVGTSRPAGQNREKELEQELAGMTVTYQALLAQHRDVERLRADLWETKQQLNATLSSFSWRAAAPLRLFMTRYPGTIVRAQAFGAKHPRLKALAARVVRVGWRLMSQGRLRAVPSAASAASPPPSAPFPALPVLRTSRICSSDGAPLNRSKVPLTSGDGKRVLCVGHVMPYPPRAGNEYRIHRMLSWLAQRGHEVLVIVCPLPNEVPNDKQIAEAASIYPRLIICERGGLVHHNLPDDSEIVRAIDGYRTKDLTLRLKEDWRSTQRGNELVGVMRSFCPDELVELVLQVETQYRPAILVAEYVFMTRFFALLDSSITKVIDALDVFSTKATKVDHYGVSDGLSLSEAEEAEMLNRADIVVGIQPDETKEIARIASRPKVVNAGVDFTVASRFRVPSTPCVVLLVASNNVMNSKGLRDFLRYSWPLIRRRVPQADLRVVGDVGKSVNFVPDGVSILGRLDDLDAAYADASVVINPVVAGTGLKIKTVEALSHLRPLVTFPAGVDGVSDAAAPFCNVATDWYGFAEHVSRLLATPPPAAELTAYGAALARALSPEVVYSQLANALDEIKY